MRTPMRFRLLLASAILCAFSDAQNLPSAPSASRPPAPGPAAPKARQQSGAPQSPQQKPDTATTSADDKKPAEDESVATIVSNVNEVPVIFSVLDRHGHYVRDLKPTDIQILDDNK